MIIVAVIMFISLIGVGIVVPLFPFFGQKVGASPELITMMIAVFAFGQFASSPVWGWLSDRIGRKPALLLSLLGGAGSYAILAVAETIEVLLLSRLLGGLMAGIAPVAFAVAADITTPDKRAAAMSKIGAAFSLGFIAGPVIGGLLAGSDPASANYVLVGGVAAGMTLAAFVVTLILFTETLTPERRTAAQGAKDGALKGFSAVQEMLRSEGLLRITIINFCFAGAFGIFDSTFALYANGKFDLGPSDIGYLFAFLGVITALVQAFLVGKLVARFGEWTVILLAIAVYIIGLISLTLSFHLIGIILSVLALAVGYSLFIPPSNSLATQSVAPHQRGTALGVFQGAGNLARSITPLFSGFIFAQVGVTAPFVAAIVFLTPALFLVMRRGGVKQPAE